MFITDAMYTFLNSMYLLYRFYVALEDCEMADWLERETRGQGGDPITLCLPTKL